MRLPLILSLLSLVSACASSPDYTCGVPATGVPCQPMNKTYDQLHDGSLASLKAPAYTSAADDQSSDSYDTFDNNESYGETTVKAEPVTVQSIHSKEALFTPPKELRIWFNRFTDADGDLHDESFVYIKIDNGHWILDNKPVIY